MTEDNILYVLAALEQFTGINNPPQKLKNNFDKENKIRIVSEKIKDELKLSDSDFNLISGIKIFNDANSECVPSFDGIKLSDNLVNSGIFDLFSIIKHKLLHVLHYTHNKNVLTIISKMNDNLVSYSLVNFSKIYGEDFGTSFNIFFEGFAEYLSRRDITIPEYESGNHNTNVLNIFINKNPPSDKNGYLYWFNVFYSLPKKGFLWYAMYEKAYGLSALLGFAFNQLPPMNKTATFNMFLTFWKAALDRVGKSNLGFSINDVSRMEPYIEERPINYGELNILMNNLNIVESIKNNEFNNFQSIIDFQNPEIRNFLKGFPNKSQLNKVPMDKFTIEDVHNCAFSPNFILIPVYILEKVRDDINFVRLFIRHRLVHNLQLQKNNIFQKFNEDGSFRYMSGSRFDYDKFVNNELNNDFQLFFILTEGFAYYLSRFDMKNPELMYGNKIINPLKKFVGLNPNSVKKDVVGFFKNIFSYNMDDLSLCFYLMYEKAYGFENTLMFGLCLNNNKWPRTMDELCNLIINCWKQVLYNKKSNNIDLKESDNDKNWLTEQDVSVI